MTPKQTQREWEELKRKYEDRVAKAIGLHYLNDEDNVLYKASRSVIRELRDELNPTALLQAYQKEVVEKIELEKYTVMDNPVELPPDKKIYNQACDDIISSITEKEG